MPWRWSRTAACPARPARCRRPSTSVPKPWPTDPSPAQIASLHAAATLRTEPLSASTQADGSAGFDLRLLGHSVALIEIPLKTP